MPSLVLAVSYGGTWTRHLVTFAMVGKIFLELHEMAEHLLMSSLAASVPGVPPLADI